MEQSDARSRVEAESTALGDGRNAPLRGRVVFVCPQLLRQLPLSLLLFLGPC